MQIVLSSTNSVYESDPKLYLEPGQILQFGEILELQVEWVDADEGQDIQNVKQEPDNQHEDVVSKDHVIYNA